MIHNLLLVLVNLLVQTLSDDILPNSIEHIKLQPIGLPNQSDLPLVVLKQGNFAINQHAAEGSNQPRPEERHDPFPVNQASPTGPYILAKKPLPGTSRCKVCYDEGKVTQREIWLQEGKDYVIDSTLKACSFSYDLSKADSLTFIYSYLSIFSIREFEQNFFVDIYSSGDAKVEELASLIIGIIFTSHDHILEIYNIGENYKTEYSAQGIITQHTLSRIQCTEGKLEHSEYTKMSLQFKVYGQMKFMKEITEDIGLIETIHVFGQPGSQTVNL